MTVAVGSRSVVRRVSAEDVASFEASRPARPDRPEPRRFKQPDTSRIGRRGNAGRDPPERRGGRARVVAFREMIANLPAIKVGDLKKGDSVFVSGTQGADASHDGDYDGYR